MIGFFEILIDFLLRLIRIVTWILIGAIILILLLILLPLFILILIIAFVFGLFGKPVFRVWTHRVQKGAQNVRSKVDSRFVGERKIQKAGSRKSAVVDADVVELDSK